MAKEWVKIFHESEAYPTRWFPMYWMPETSEASTCGFYYIWTWSRSIIHLIMMVYCDHNSLYQRLCMQFNVNCKYYVLLLNLILIGTCSSQSPGVGWSMVRCSWMRPSWPSQTISVSSPPQHHEQSHTDSCMQPMINHQFSISHHCQLMNIHSCM